MLLYNLGVLTWRACFVRILYMKQQIQEIREAERTVEDP